MPEVRLRAPGFDCQSAADANKDDEQVCFEIGTTDDRNGHEAEDAKQQPVDIAPPGALPIHVFEILLSKRPPNVDDQENCDEKPTQQNTAVARPELCSSGAERWHERHYTARVMKL